MSTFLPVGLTYQLSTNPDTPTALDVTAVTSATGKTGPMILKVYNNSLQPAVIGYSNSLVPTPPPAPITYTNCTYFGNGGATATLDVTVDTTQSLVTATVVTSSSSYYQDNSLITITGNQIGGTSGVNDIVFLVTATVSGDPGVLSEATEVAYYSGTVPSSSNGIDLTLPSDGSPTKNVVIPKGTIEYVQIPNSVEAPFFDTVYLAASVDGVFVTPIQVIA